VRQPKQVTRGHGDATGRGRAVSTRNVQKYGTAPTSNSWAQVVIDFDHKIIEMIGPPQAIAGLPG